jgi:uncharacterized protein (DUF302 family)
MNSNPSYGITKNLGKGSIDQFRPLVEEKLKEVGFGVLTEIDVTATLKKKINVDFRPYLILGACHPKIAHEALKTEAGIGLLLPCNVVMSQEENGEIIVSAIDPSAMFEVVHRPDVQPLAEKVKELLQTAIDSL